MIEPYPLQVKKAKSTFLVLLNQNCSPKGNTVLHVCNGQDFVSDTRGK